MKIAIAGTTAHTVMCADALSQDSRFEISWVLTPSPRKVGRKQELVKNPLHVWAEEHHVSIVFVESKIDQKVQQEVEKANKNKVDFLLVVDFGYIVPNWLLELPQIAPVNIHPSDLPKYRGSSPGQFVLLFGEKDSAVSIIKMDDLLDHGDLIYQSKIEVLNTWTMSEYYQQAFDIISKQLPNVLADFAAGKITPTPQTDDSPTPIARRLNRDDGFISWESLNAKTPPNDVSELLKEVYEKLQNWPQTVVNAVRAFSPWPGVWTLVQTTKGEKRMKILEASLRDGQLELETVQIEGQQPTSLENVRNQIQ